MIRVRNTHPSITFQCSGRILAPGVWHEVDEAFRNGHGDMPELEFETPAPAKLSATMPVTSDLLDDVPPHDRGLAAGFGGGEESDCPFPDRRTRPAKEWLRGFRKGRADREALLAQPDAT